MDISEAGISRDKAEAGTFSPPAPEAPYPSIDKSYYEVR